MPKIPYRVKKISPERLGVIAKANEILDEYEAQGFDLTLRQLYYQFVARDLIQNNLRSYKRLGDIIDDGRMCGLIDWDRIEDRTRNLEQRGRFKNPGHVIEAAANAYHLDRWAGQDCRVEVWCEKEALIGIFERIARQLDCPYFACRGYVSQSEMWRAAQRMIKVARGGQQPVILHFGDHDPSGIDMTRDIHDRLAVFGADVQVERLALNMDQVDTYDPPPNPAKVTDARFQSYAAKYGNTSWELDALDPPVLMNLVGNAVYSYRDVDKWRAIVEKEQNDLATLNVLQRKYPQIWSHINTTYDDLVEEQLEKVKDDVGYFAELQDDAMEEDES